MTFQKQLVLLYAYILSRYGTMADISIAHTSASVCVRVSDALIHTIPRNELGEWLSHKGAM